MLSIQVTPVHQLPNGALLSVQGSFSQDGFPAFEEKLRSLEALGVLFFILDFSRVKFLSSIAAAFLFNLAETLHERGGGVALCGCNRSIETVLKLLGATESLRVLPTFKEAIAGFSSPG